MLIAMSMSNLSSLTITTVTSLLLLVLVVNLLSVQTCCSFSESILNTFSICLMIIITNEIALNHMIYAKHDAIIINFADTDANYV